MSRTDKFMQAIDSARVKVTLPKPDMLERRYYAEDQRHTASFSVGFTVSAATDVAVKEIAVEMIAEITKMFADEEASS
jgi:hypothetical protein